MSEKEKIELLDFLKEMVLKYPNDQERSGLPRIPAHHDGSVDPRPFFDKQNLGAYVALDHRRLAKDQLLVHRQVACHGSGDVAVRRRDVAKHRRGGGDDAFSFRGDVAVDFARQTEIAGHGDAAFDEAAFGDDGD